MIVETPEQPAPFSIHDAYSELTQLAQQLDAAMRVACRLPFAACDAIAELVESDSARVEAIDDALSVAIGIGVDDAAAVQLAEAAMLAADRAWFAAMYAVRSDGCLPAEALAHGATLVPK